MQCPRCGTENREGSNFCRYCAMPLAAQPGDPGPGYIPTVPPPDARTHGNYYPPTSFQPPPQPLARSPVGHMACPRCGSMNIVKGGTPQWAVLMTIFGFFIFCLFSLFFLLIKDPNHCLNCGLEFR
jgi:hypothetical protein